MSEMSPALRALAARGTLRRYRRHTLLIQEGDVGDTLYIILEGQLRAFSSAENGREVTYGIYGPGEYQGEMSLDGGPRSASVETLTAATCVVVTRDTILAHIGEHPEFALELLAKVIRRARMATLSTRQLALNDVYGRLKAWLEARAVDSADGLRLLLERHSHRHIAEQLGCSREMISRILKELDRGGYCQPQADGRLQLLKPLPARW